MKCKMESGSHNRILLEQFKSWAQKSKKSDKVFEHNLSLLMYHGPLLHLYDHATAYGDGNARELVYQLQIPIYAQLGFRNYCQETFRAVVNLLAKWPKATRELVKQNCSVNLSGQEGHGIELDAFVESEVVRPLKVYSSGHTTVKMSERIMGNINLFKLVRAKYKSKEGFNVYHTSRHLEQSPFPDQLKGAWFLFKKQFLL